MRAGKQKQVRNDLPCREQALAFYLLFSVSGREKGREDFYIVNSNKWKGSIPRWKKEVVHTTAVPTWDHTNEQGGGSEELDDAGHWHHNTAPHSSATGLSLACAACVKMQYISAAQQLVGEHLNAKPATVRTRFLLSELKAEGG